MPGSTIPSIFNATSSPDPHCGCSEPKLPLIGEALSQRHDPTSLELGKSHTPPIVVATPMFAIGSFTLAARPSRRNLAPRPAKSGMPGKFPQ
jgi:hypothetical protein